MRRDSFLESLTFGSRLPNVGETLVFRLSFIELRLTQ